jgi:DNA repair exonuclease SbcCD ATPase subunit
MTIAEKFMDMAERAFKERDEACAEVARLKAEIEGIIVVRNDEARELRAENERLTDKVRNRDRLREMADAEIERLQAWSEKLAAERLQDRAEIEQLQTYKRAQMADIMTLGQQVGKLEAEIERLTVTLNYVVDMTYCGTDAEWHFKPGYDPQTVLDALEPRP